MEKEKIEIDYFLLKNMIESLEKISNWYLINKEQLENIINNKK